MEDGDPSVTARRVAAHRLGFSRVPAAYGAPDADQALAADVAAGLVAPENRMHDYLAARTSFFDRTVVSAIDRGVRQVVVGAAGYDGRAFRYAKPGVRWFEVDHPATQRDKLERLERLGIAAPLVQFVEADFTRDPVADRLRAAGLKAGVPSLFLLEGVAVYLEPAVLETVLEQFRQVAAPGSRLAISVSLSREHDEGARARFQAAVAALGEPARSTFEAGEAEDLLARTGWRTIPGRGETAAKRERLRSAGLLTASAGPRAPQASAPSKRSKPSAAPPSPASRPGSLSLSALLSQALVAYTIEFDNEAEHRLPHRTTDHGASGHGDGGRRLAGVAGHVGELPTVRHRPADHRRRTRDPRPHRNQPRWHAALGLHHHRRHLEEDPQGPAGPGRRPARHRRRAAGAPGVAAAAWPHRAALAGTLRRRPGRPAAGVPCDCGQPA